MVSNGSGADDMTKRPVAASDCKYKEFSSFNQGDPRLAMTNTNDKNRKWMWWLLGVGLALQMYFVRELLAAFAIFAAFFAVIAVLIGGIYMLQQAWVVGVAHVAHSRNPVVNFGRRALSAMEEVGRRPFRRPI
jgi:hypothetical protein